MSIRPQLGESFVGSGANAAHVNTVLGARDGAVGIAWTTALASPSAGHAPFVAVLRPGLPVKPYTLFVNKAAIDEIVDPDAVDALVIVAAVWVDPGADDEVAVFENNSRATFEALRAGRDRLPATDDMLAAIDSPSNPFFGGPPQR